METQIVETNQLIAQRVPPGDQWVLVDDPKEIIHPTITDALEAWFDKTGMKVEFRLAPLDSKLYAILKDEEEITPEPVKRYNIYGDPV